MKRGPKGHRGRRWAGGTHLRRRSRRPAAPQSCCGRSSSRGGCSAACAWWCHPRAAPRCWAGRASPTRGPRGCVSCGLPPGRSCPAHDKAIVSWAEGTHRRLCAGTGWGGGAGPGSSTSLSFGSVNQGGVPLASPHPQPALGPPSRPRRPHLADVVPEDGLILGAPDLPLEPRLGLPVVGDLQGGGAVPDLGQVRHGVPHGDGAEGARVRPGRKEEAVSGPEPGRSRLPARHQAEASPGDVADELLVVHHHAELTGPRGKDVQRLGEHGQLLAGCRGQDDGSPPRLGHTVLASLGRRRSETGVSPARLGPPRARNVP